MKESPIEIIRRFVITYGILTIGAVMLGFVAYMLLDWCPILQTMALVIAGILYGWIGALVWRNNFDDD